MAQGEIEAALRNSETKTHDIGKDREEEGESSFKLTFNTTKVSVKYYSLSLEKLKNY